MNNCSQPVPFATTTPADYPIAEAFGYTTNNQNFPGLITLTFLPESTIAGYAISLQTSMLALTFQNLKTVPGTALFNIQGNTVMTSLSCPELVTLTPAGLALNITANAALTSVSMPVLTTTRGWAFNNNNAMLNLSLPALALVSASTHNLSNNSGLQSISMPVLTATASALNVGTNVSLIVLTLTLLQTVGGAFTLTGNVALTSLNLPAFVSAASFAASGCTALTTISFPNYVPPNGGAINFGGAALTQASVDHVLARAVANAAYVTGTITLNGGTSASPGTQGQTDKATLQARGVTVLTN